MLKIEPEASMCRCGQVWLLAGRDVFPAEGRMHTRTGCARYS